MIVKGTDEFRDGTLFVPIFGNMPGLSYIGAVQTKTPYSGQQWVLSYESAANTEPHIPSIAQVCLALTPSGFEARVDATGPVHRLTVVTPDIPSGDGSLGVQETQFELLGNALQKDVREHPKALALGSAVVRTIDCVLNQSVDPNTNDVPTQAEIPSGDATELYNILSQRSGSAAYQVSQFVLRYTRIASFRATVDVGYSGVEKIHTTDQMIAQTGPPSGILAAIADAVEAARPTTVPSGYFFGWLKQTPTVTTMAGNKTQITGEYWLEVWSTWMYATA